VAELITRQVIGQIGADRHKGQTGQGDTGQEHTGQDQTELILDRRRIAAKGRRSHRGNLIKWRGVIIMSKNKLMPIKFVNHAAKLSNIRD
jgi:hypothetical protein